MNISIFIALIIILINICTILFSKNKSKTNIIFLNISFVFLYIILVIRKPYSDLEYFVNIFEYFNGDFSLINTTRYDFLYKLFNIIIGKIWLNKRFFIAVVDLITLAGPYYIIKKYSKNYFYSVLFFISIGTYHLQFYVIRQAMALSFILFSVKYIEEKNFLKYFIFVIIASMFHTSAIIFLPVYFVSKIKINRDVLISYFVLLVILFIFKDYIATLIIKYSGYYSLYSGSKYDISSEGQWRFMQYILMSFFIILFSKNCYYQKNNLNNNNIIDNCMLVVMLINVVILELSMGSIIIDRLSYYFSFPEYINTINVTDEIENKKFKTAINILFIILVFGYLYLVSPIKGYSTIF